MTVELKVLGESAGCSSNFVADQVDIDEQIAALAVLVETSNEVGAATG